MVWIKLLTLVLAFGGGMFAPTLRAEDLFMFQGPLTRASGGASEVFSRSGASVLHNPSHLVRRPSGGHFDLGLTQLTFSFDPKEEGIEAGEVSLPVVPLLSLGGHYRWSNWAVGVIFVPLGLPGASQKIEDFPFRLGDVTATVDAKAEATSYLLGFGIAMRFYRSFSVGLRLLQRRVEESLELLSDQTGEPVLALDNRSDQWIPKLGLSGRVHKAHFGVSYQPEVKSAYQLSTQLASGESGELKGDLYSPPIYSLGLAYRVHSLLTPYVQLSREEWVKGTYQNSDPLDKASYGDADATDYLNTTNMTLGVRIHFKGRRSLYASYAFAQSNKGPGLYNDEQDILLSGVGSRDFEGLERKAYTVGFSDENRAYPYSAYLRYLSGEKTAPEGTPSQGSYELTVWMLGMGFLF